RRCRHHTDNRAAYLAAGRHSSGGRGPASHRVRVFRTAPDEHRSPLKPATDAHQRKWLYAWRASVVMGPCHLPNYRPARRIEILMHGLRDASVGLVWVARGRLVLR